MMAYDESSVTGDEICDYYYDLENNFMNPPSPTGYFIYKVIGGCFDWLGEIIGQFRIDLGILDASVGNVELVSAFPEEPDTSHAYYVPNYTATGGSLTKYSYNGTEWVSETLIVWILSGANPTTSKDQPCLMNWMGTLIQES